MKNVMTGHSYYTCVYVLSIKLHFEILLNETVKLYKPI
jgi:hypothetical protein